MNVHTHGRQRLCTCTDRGECENLAPGRSASGLCFRCYKTVPGPRNPARHFFLSSYVRVAGCGPVFCCQEPAATLHYGLSSACLNGSLVCVLAVSAAAERSMMRFRLCWDFPTHGLSRISLRVQEPTHAVYTPSLNYGS